jgi:ABC-type Mn2+/Zn2+ transport system permease subunit
MKIFKYGFIGSVVAMLIVGFGTFWIDSLRIIREDILLGLTFTLVVSMLGLVINLIINRYGKNKTKTKTED